MTKIINIKSNEVAMIDALLASYLLSVLATKTNNKEAAIVANRINLYNHFLIAKNHTKEEMLNITKAIVMYSEDIIPSDEKENFDFINQLIKFTEMIKDANGNVEIKPSVDYLNMSI